MRLGNRGACLFLAFGLVTYADVNYDVVESAKWPPPQTDAAVPWTNGGLFASSPKVYAPVLEGTSQGVVHVHIRGHRLLVAASNVGRLYDLDAGTLTIINFQAGTYAVENFDAAMEQYREAISRHPARDFRVSVTKTGKTARLNDQDATEYEVVAIRKPSGKREIKVRSLCWVADHAPSAELNEFRKSWFARTKLPFPIDSLSSDKTSDAFKAIVEAQAKIPGYVLGFVTEAKPAESRIDLQDKPSATYDARYTHLPDVQSAQRVLSAAPAMSYDPLIHPLAPNRLIQFNLSNFTNKAIDTKAFEIPSGFRQKRKAL